MRNAQDSPEPRKRRPWPVHPLLFATVPVLALWVHNLSEGITLGDVIPALLVTLGGAAAAMVTASLLLRRDFLKGGLVAASLVVLVFAYRPVASALGDRHIGGTRIAPPPVILGLCVLLLVGAIVAIVRARPARMAGLTSALNVVAAGLVLFNALTIGVHQFRSNRVAVDSSGILQAAAQGATPAGKPDIYYIVLDDYGGERAMRDLLGFDNRPFLDALAQRGFYVPEHPSTNYARTSFYLASTLNLQYLDTLIPAGTVIDEENVRPYVLDDAVPKFLKSKGYRYIHIGSWAKETATNPQADVNVTLGHGLSEFSSALLDQTAFEPALEAFASLAWDRQQYDRVLFQFDQLAKSRSVRGPKFVFGHVLVPHWPFIFDQNGRFSDARNLVRDIKVPLSQVSEDVRRRYVDQVQFANRKTLALIDQLLSGPPESRPVVVLQSDEGFFTWLTEGSGAGDEELEQHFGVMAAYYFPRLQTTGLYPTITPVNSFRLLFNDYFGAQLPLLPDRNLVLEDPRVDPPWVDVTDRVKALV